VQLVHSPLTDFGATDFSIPFKKPTQSAPLAVINPVSCQNDPLNRDVPNVNKYGKFNNDAGFHKPKIREESPVARAVTMLS